MWKTGLYFTYSCGKLNRPTSYGGANLKADALDECEHGGELGIFLKYITKDINTNINSMQEEIDAISEELNKYAKVIYSCNNIKDFIQ